MTRKIFDVVLSSLNRRLVSQKRSILLVLDNAGCHPKDGEYSNIKLPFLPPNTTAQLQPLDLGIIQNFKIHYKRRLLQYVLARIEESESASEVVKSVNVLTAIRWVAQAWKEVKSETIQKCFRNAGILDNDMEVSQIPDNDDLYEDIDQAQVLQELILETNLESACYMEEYVQSEDSLPICHEYDDEKWDDQFMSRLASESATEEPTEPGEDDEDHDVEVTAEIEAPL